MAGEGAKSVARPPRGLGDSNYGLGLLSSAEYVRRGSDGGGDGGGDGDGGAGRAGRTPRDTQGVGASGRKTL